MRHLLRHGNATQFLSASILTFVAVGAAYVAVNHQLLAIIVALAGIALLLVVALRVTALEIVVATAPLMAEVSLGGGASNLAASDAMVPFLVIASFKTLYESERRLAHHIPIYAIILTLAATLSAGSQVIQQDAWSATSLLKLGIALAYLVCVAILAQDALRRGDVRFIAVWATAATIISLFSLVDRALGAGVPVVRSVVGRSAGTFEDPNLFGAYLIASIALTLWLYKSGKRKAWLVAATLQLLALPTTGSRGAMAAVILAATVVFLLRRITSTTIVISALLLTFYLIGLGQTVTSEATSSSAPWARLIQDTDLGDEARGNLWSSAISLWQDSPIFGIGPGNFQFAAFEMGATSKQLVVHNTYLGFLVEYGIIGFCAFIWLWISTLTNTMRMAHVSGQLRPLLFGFIGYMVSMISLNLENVRITWIWLALIISVITLERERLLQAQAMELTGKKKS